MSAGAPFSPSGLKPSLRYTPSTRMKVSVRSNGACRKVLEIEVPAGVVAEEHRAVVDGFRRVARVPGFRQGRAPAAVVERRYAREIIEETRDRLLPRCYREALKEKGINPVAVIGVSDAEVRPGTPLSFSVTVDVPPDFRLPRYKGLPLKGAPAEVSDSRVDEAMTEWRKRHARFEDAPEGEAAAGDLVQVDYSGRRAGEPLAGKAGVDLALAQGRDCWVMLGGPELLPGLSAALIGARGGETREITIRFPADFHVPAVAGSTAEYTVTVKARRRRLLPELDDDLLAGAGVRTETELRAAMREELLKAAETAAKAGLKEQIVQYLLKKTHLELPRSLVEEETRHIVQDVVYRNAMRGVTREQIEERREDILSEATRSSAERVKISYILARIAEEEAVEVSEAEVDERIASIAARNGVPAERLRAHLEKRNAIESIRNYLRSNKALEIVLAQARVKTAR